MLDGSASAFAVTHKIGLPVDLLDSANPQLSVRNTIGGNASNVSGIGFAIGNALLKANPVELEKAESILIIILRTLNSDSLLIAIAVGSESKDGSLTEITRKE